MFHPLFKVKSTFELTHNKIVVTGEILSGEVNANMFLNSGSLSISINSIEYVDFPEGLSLIGLLFKDKSESELANLRDIQENEVFTIVSS